MLKVNYSVHECVIIALTVQRACNQTCSGRFHSAVDAGVCGSPGGKPGGSDWLNRGGIALKHVCGVFAAQSCACVCVCVCVCVCLHIGAVSLLLFTQYLFISLTLTAQRERRGGEREEKEGRGSGEKESKKRPRDGIRAVECGHGVLEFYRGGVLSGAFEAGYARECDRVME